MERAGVIELELDADIKAAASRVLAQQGLSLAEAIAMFLERIAEDGCCPFMVHAAEISDAAISRQDGIGAVDGGRN